MLNKSIYTLKLNPLLICTLDKLEYTKIGHLVMASYPELLFTNCFNDEEINEIRNSLIDKNLNFITEIKDPKLECELIKFNFNEYQNMLKKAHHTKEKNIEKIRYSDLIKIVKPLYYLYTKLYQNNYYLDEKILLNNFIKTHPYLTIADFVCLNENLVDSDTLKLIGNILGTPINYYLKIEEIMERENKIFARENIQNEIVQGYEIFQNDNKINLSKKPKTLTKEKKHGNR